MDPKVESNLNLVSSHTASIAGHLETVVEHVIEICVRQAEEEDGRINERYNFVLFGSLLQADIFTF
jgi:hypothetical protein